jgi:hypothetical protein
MVYLVCMQCREVYFLVLSIQTSSAAKSYTAIASPYASEARAFALA